MSATPAQQPFGTLANVSKTYDGGVVALAPVDYALAAGELVALLGPSGCGKTTLLRMVAGLTRPTTGTITIRGRTVEGPQLDFGFAFQALNLLPWRSVLSNVLFPLKYSAALMLRRAPAPWNCCAWSVSMASRNPAHTSSPAA